MYEEMKATEISDRKTDFSKDLTSHKFCLNSDTFGLGHFISPHDLVVDVGDLVQIDRMLYSDWVLYVGDGNVVHICALDEEIDIPTNFAVVKLSNLCDVAGFSGVRVNNKIVGAKERNLEPLSAEEVVRNTCELLDKVVEFNMLTRNSEHYVTEWKYGLGWSDQATVTMNVMRTLSSDSTIGHNVLVSSLNAVLNSPGSPVSRSPPRFSGNSHSSEDSTHS